MNEWGPPHLHDTTAIFSTLPAFASHGLFDCLIGPFFDNKDTPLSLIYSVSEGQVDERGWDNLVVGGVGFDS